MPIEITAAERRTIGRRLRVQREYLGLTQSALAARMFVSQPTIVAWEHGKYLPNFRTQNVLCDELRQRRSDLFRELCAAENRAVA